MCCVFAIDSDSALKKFLDETADMTAEDRAKKLEKNQVLHPIASKQISHGKKT